MVQVIPSQRLIMALDFNNSAEALKMVETLGDSVSFYKVGLELFVSEGQRLVKDLIARNKRVFLDLKIDDVPETISRTVATASRIGVDFLTILGWSATATAAAKTKGDWLKTLQITLLTSMNEQDLVELGLVGPDKRFASKDEFVMWRAETAKLNGCDGVIASGQDAARLRAKLGPDFLIVCPGIRLEDTATQDHKRPATPYNTILDGADYLVVGRPIRDSQNPADTAKQIVGEIERALTDRGDS